MKQFNHVILISIVVLGCLMVASALQARHSIKLPLLPVDKNSPEYLRSLEYEKQMQQYVPVPVSSESRIIRPMRTTFPNFPVSAGSTNTTGFSHTAPAGAGVPWDDALRDSHFNDAYNGIIAFAWTDNSTVSVQNTLNCMVAIGTDNGDGSYTINPPVNLTGFTNEEWMFAWDTAVAINRMNPLNIVVSWLLINYTTGLSYPYLAYSNDGGNTWSSPELLTQQPASQNVGDNRGIASDKYGNIWYLTTNYYNSDSQAINQPYFSVSSDGGSTFDLAYTVPLLPDFIIGTSIYDYPQYCFGGLGDGSGDYGLWFSIEYHQHDNVIPVVGFIPISGLGIDSVGTGTVYELTSFTNMQFSGSLNASVNGRVWCESVDFHDETETTVPVASRFKSPGAISTNYWGPYDIATVGVQTIQLQAGEDSQPARGYFNVTIQSNMYDEARQALYALVTNQIPDEIGEQNMQILFYISRNNGQTWPSTPINIATTTTANRGFPSMALDTVTGDLLFGWYDGRNDGTFESVEYYAAIVSAATLDTLANSVQGALPSYPIYPIPF